MGIALFEASSGTGAFFLLYNSIPISLSPRELNMTELLLKAPYSSQIDILLPKKGLKNSNTIIKCGIWQPVKFQLVSRSWIG